MSKPKRHHFVPESYQRLFWDAARKQIAELDLTSGVTGWFNPSSRCVKRHLYRTDQLYQGFERTFLENPFFSGIDDSYPRAVKALKFGDKQSVDRMVIAKYVAFLRFRNLWALNTITACSSDSIKRALFERVATGQIVLPHELHLRTSSVDAFLEDLDGIEISWGKDGSLGAMLGLSMCFLAELLACKWRLFYAPDGGFISSDKPVSANEIEVESGLLLYFLIPISSHWMLQAGQGLDNETVFCEAGVDEIEEGNLAVACCADRKLLGASEAQLKKVYDLRKIEQA